MLGFTLSIRRKKCPDQSGDEAFLSQFQALEVIVEGQEATIRELTTSIQRIERKQNRWLSIFNLDSKDLEKAAQGDKSQELEPAALPVNAGGNGQAGDTEYD